MSRSLYSRNYSLFPCGSQMLGSTALMNDLEVYRDKMKSNPGNTPKNNLNVCMFVAVLCTFMCTTEGLPSKTRIKIIRGSLLRNSSLNFNLKGFQMNAVRVSNQYTAQ